MPINLLNVPQYEQAHAGSCLPACVRMILAFWQYEISEEALAELFGTQQFGTPAPRIHRLEQLNFSVIYESGTLSTIATYLNRTIPCLVFLKTGDLPYWHGENTAHVVVVVGFNEETISVNDPAFTKAPQNIPLDYFLLAWSEFDHRYAVIQPK